MKGLILAAGKGTRLFPLTRYTPKPLIKVNGKEVIRYCIDNLLDVSITNIGIVINPDHEKQFKKALSNIPNVNITYIHQDKQKGIAHAIEAAQSFIGNEQFICLLGDNIITSSLSTIKAKLLNSDAVLSLQYILYPKGYGVANLRNGKIVKVEEKPEHTFSNLAIMGAYGFNQTIFEAIFKTMPSINGEYEITHAIQHLINDKREIDYTMSIKQTFYDMGTFERLKVAKRLFK